MSNVTDNVFKFNRVKRIDRRNTRSLCVNLQNSNVQFTSHQFENYFCTDLNHTISRRVSIASRPTAHVNRFSAMPSFDTVVLKIGICNRRLRIDLNNCNPWAHPIADTFYSAIFPSHSPTLLVLCTVYVLLFSIFRSEKESNLSFKKFIQV